MAAAGAPDGDHQAVSGAHQKPKSWKKFFVHLAGQTNGVHLQFVKLLRSMRHKEVSAPEESDYILMVCPVTSRVGTDVSDALEFIPAEKPVILLMMHHTPNPDVVVPETRREVCNPLIHLTVDFLFHNGKLLKCNRNKFAWIQVMAFIAQSYQDDSRKRKIIFIVLMVSVLVMVALVVIVLSLVV